MASKYVQTSDLQRQLDFMSQIRQLHTRKMHYYIYTYGCQLNDNDSEKLSAMLAQMGYQKCDEPTKADIILLNTCSVRGNADHRFFGNLGIVKTFKKDHPDLIVGVCGCMMQIEEHVEKVKQSYPFVDIIFGTSDVYRLPELLHRRLSGFRRVYDVGTDDIVAEGVPVQHERKFRALCTIMYGCNNFCTYCIVPYTRGRERSRDFDTVIQELKELAEQGFTEVMLLGQNVNAYGKDLKSDTRDFSFANLLKTAAEETGLKRIRFMTSHPKDIDRRLIDIMASHSNIERHLHLPLQSGSDRILKLMNRHYTVDRYMEMIQYCKQVMPDIAFSTDIIVGFPGETEEDFQKTLDIVKTVGYDSAYMFQYSPRIGTPAALEKNQIPQEIVSERFNRLVDIQNQNSQLANERRVGHTYEVLIEGISDHKKDMLTGRASDNHLINFFVPDETYAKYNVAQGDLPTLGAKMEGKLVQVRIDYAKMFSLEGMLLNP